MSSSESAATSPCCTRYPPNDVMLTSSQKAPKSPKFHKITQNDRFSFIFIGDCESNVHAVYVDLLPKLEFTHPSCCRLQIRPFSLPLYQINTVGAIKTSAKAAPLLVGFTNYDWAGDPDDRKSTAGYVFTLGSGPITWACKKQAAISLSSAEAEYRGVVEASKEALWLHQILSEFGFEQQHPTTLWCDNQSAIQLCKDPVQHQCRKHIELHMHFIRKLIHAHVLEVQYCSTDDQVADIFTKALTEAKFTKLRYMLGVQEVVTKGG
eukprot:PITA_30481